MFWLSLCKQSWSRPYYRSPQCHSRDVLESKREIIAQVESLSAEHWPSFPFSLNVSRAFSSADSTTMRVNRSFEMSTHELCIQRGHFSIEPPFVEWKRRITEGRAQSLLVNLVSNALHQTFGFVYSFCLFTNLLLSRPTSIRFSPQRFSRDWCAFSRPHFTEVIDTKPNLTFYRGLPYQSLSIRNRLLA